MNKKYKDLTGMTFNNWKVIRYAFTGKNMHTDAFWECECMKCGDLHIVRSDSLQSGRSRQCKRCAALERA